MYSHLNAPCEERLSCLQRLQSVPLQSVPLKFVSFSHSRHFQTSEDLLDEKAECGSRFFWLSIRFFRSTQTATARVQISTHATASSHHNFADPPAWISSSDP